MDENKKDNALEELNEELENTEAPEETGDVTEAEAEAYDPNAQNGENRQELSEEKAQATNEKIKKAVEELNKKMANSEAVYGIHDGTNRVTIKIVDKKTHDTIKELPAEKTLDMIAKVWEMAGILVDEKR